MAVNPNSFTPLCLFLGAAVILGGTAVFGANPEVTETRLGHKHIGGIVRNSEGNMRVMNWNEAQTYCQNQGGRLPFAMEIAIESNSDGVKPISLGGKYAGEADEERYSLDQPSDIEPLGEPSFHYDPKTFDPLETNDLSFPELWTASWFSFEEGATIPYVFNYMNGRIYGDNSDVKPFRCIFDTQ